MPTATPAVKRKAAIERATTDDGGADRLACSLEELAEDLQVIPEEGEQVNAPITGALPGSITQERAREIAQQMEDVTLPRLIEIMTLLRGRAAE